MDQNSISVTPPDPSEVGDSAFEFTSERPPVETPEIPRSRSTTSLALSDLALFVAVVLIAGVGFSQRGDAELGELVAFGLLGTIGLSLTLWWRNAYVYSRSVNWDGNISVALTSVVGVVFAMITAAWFFEFTAHRLWQFALAIGWGASALLIRMLMARRVISDQAPVKVIVAGNTGDALATRLALRADPRTNYEVEGFVMDSLDQDVPEVVSRLALGSIDQLPHVVKRARADLVVVCLGAIDAERFAPLSRQLNVLGVDVALSTGLSNVALRRVSLGHISGRPLVRVTAAPLAGWQLGVKRMLDVLGASLLLIATAPLMLLTMLAIRIEDGGAPIFRQVRVGKAGRPFKILKFRTMVMNADQMTIDLRNDHEGPVFKMTNDPRITKVGALLRKTSIDELPQLINIIRGEMSLVGPRPLPVHEVAAAPAAFLDRQAVKPGLTGRWQVSGRSDTGFKELDELDRWYVDNWSLGQDFEILARTVPAVLLARGAR